MTAHLEASRAYPVEIGHAFDRTIAHPLPDLFRRRYGPLPPIKAVTGFTEPWSTVGQTRTIHLADGGTMLEELTEVDRPRRFAYRISEIAGAMKPLVARPRGRLVVRGRRHRHPGHLVLGRATRPPRPPAT